MASLTSLVRLNSAIDGGRVSLAARVPFFIPNNDSFLGKAGNHSFSSCLPFYEGPKPHRIFTSHWSLWPGLNPTSHFSAPQNGWFHWLGGQEHSASLQNHSPCMTVLVQVFFILPFGLVWLGSEPGSLLACFCFLQQFPKQHGRSVPSTDIAAPTPELCFN